MIGDTANDIDPVQAKLESSLYRQMVFDTNTILDLSNTEVNFKSLELIIEHMKLHSGRISEQLAEAKARIEYLESLCFKNGLMEKSPCFKCGYSGSGYFQPDQHPCSAYHNK